MGDEKVRRIQLLRSGCFSKQHAAESYSSDDNPVEYASGRMSETASRVLHKSSDEAAAAGRQGAKAMQAAVVNARKNAGERQLKKSVYKGNVRDITLRENGRAALARSRARAKAVRDAEGKTAAKAGEKTAKATAVTFAGERPILLDGMRYMGMECPSIRGRKIRRLIKKQRVRKQIRNSGMQNCIPLTL